MLLFLYVITHLKVFDDFFSKLVYFDCRWNCFFRHVSDLPVKNTKNIFSLKSHMNINSIQNFYHLCNNNSSASTTTLSNIPQPIATNAK